ncbi:MAG: hypothetical protein EXR50_02135 [Dehalococcoidia bacterium]|nr:hypothetical protein [Dehalococcoidia bacterium]
MADLKVWVKNRADEDVRLYERYGKPLERDHFGEYVAIGPDGELILGHDDLEVTQKASARFGSGSYAFRRVGYPWEEKWRSSRFS